MTPKWKVSGSYFEACNCDAPCPCRKIGETPGGRSTYDTCDFALSWAINDGRYGTVALSGLHVALAGRWDNSEEAMPGFPAFRPPWHVMLYVDERGAREQREALTAIFLGRAGGTPFQNYAKLIGEVYAVKPARIEVSHAPGREYIRIGARVEVENRSQLNLSEPITCGISGHDQAGTESVAKRLVVNDVPLAFAFEGRCAFAAGFDYRSDV